MHNKHVFIQKDFILLPKLSDCQGLPACGGVALAKQVERSEIPPSGGR